MADEFVLVKFERNWADEFDVKGFLIIKKTEWEDHLNWIRDRMDWPQENGFGTNQSIIWVSAKEYLSSFKVVDVSVDEAAIILKYFERASWEKTGYGYGLFLSLLDVVEEYRSAFEEDGEKLWEN